MNKLGWLLAVCAVSAGHVWAQETITVDVGPAGTDLMQFELRASGAMRLPGGIQYVGDASLVTPLGRMVLAQSELWFGYAEGTERVETVRGKSFVPTPLSGEAVSIDEPVMAEVGYDRGANLRDLGVPLQDTRGYLFFRFDAGLTMRVGKAPPEDLAEEEDTSFTISFPAGATARIVVDPLDPMYYFAGGVSYPNKKPKQDGEGGEGGGAEGSEGSGKEPGTGEGEAEDDGIITGSGSSVQGLFPFRPLVKWGIEDVARQFNGHRIKTGTFPLFSLPVQVRGHLITNLDPLATGALAIDPLGIGFGPAAQAGANGRFALSLDYLKVTGLGKIINLTIPLGKATAAVEIVNGRQLAYLSGILDPAEKFQAGLFLAQDGELKVAAAVSAEPRENRLFMEGKYTLGASEFGKMTGFDVGNLMRIEASLRADQTGLFVRGLSEAGVNAGPLKSNARLSTELEIPANAPENSFYQLAGEMQFAGLGMNAVSRVSRGGLAITGRTTAPKFELAVNGGVQKPQNGQPFVYGNMSVPDGLQPDFQSEIKKAASEAQSELDRTLSAYQKATKDFEFELSLRGMRTVIPPATDAIIAEIDRQIVSNLNARWPKTSTIFGTIEAPGKSAALSYARSQADPHEARLRELKRRVQSGDSATVRAAIEAAIRALIANPRLRITYRVPVIGTNITIYDDVIIDATMTARLNLALAGVRALPDVSTRKVSAEDAWNRLPKREILRQTGEAIEKGITAAIPRVESIGFRFPLGQVEWIYQVIVLQQGKRSSVEVRLRPDNIASFGIAIGQALAKVL